MRADVFQAVALCCHSNAYLSGEVDRAPDLLNNSTFRPVNEVRFERDGMGKLGGGLVADATAPWLRRLSKESVSYLGLSLSGCPLDPVAPSSEPWGIISDGDVGVEIWQPDWKKRIRTHSDTSPWKVTYTAKRAIRGSVHAPFSLEDSSKLISSAVRHAASAHPLLEELALGEQNAFPDLFPEGWPTEKRELGTFAARTATLIRSDEWARVISQRELTSEDHEALSQRLWKASLMALETACRYEEAALEHPTAQSFRLTG